MYENWYLGIMLKKDFDDRRLEEHNPLEFFSLKHSRAHN